MRGAHFFNHYTLRLKKSQKKEKERRVCHKEGTEKMKEKKKEGEGVDVH